MRSQQLASSTQAPREWGIGWVQPATASEVSDRGRDYARVLGAGLSPMFGLPAPWGWQSHALAMLATEREPGVPQYSTASIILCRQNGKTTLLYYVIADKLLKGVPTLFTAHERQKAREKWDEVATMLCRAAPNRYKTRRAIGSEKIIDTATGAACVLATPDDAGGRSDTAGCVIVDEAAHIRPAFLRAARATMLTRPDAQIVMISSGMTDASVDLADARERAYDDLPKPAAERRFGVLEWAAKTTPGAEDIDAADEDLWARCIPTLDLPGGASRDALRDAQRTMPHDDFCREYLSVPTGSPLSPPITPARWEAVQAADLPPVKELSPRVVAVDTSPDQSRSSIAVAGADRTGMVHVALLSNGRGDDWLWDDLQQALNEARPHEVLIDRLSPAARLLDRGASRGDYDYRGTGANDMARSAASFLSMVNSGGVSAVRDDALSVAALSAVRRNVTDAGWAWNRRDGTSTDITPLVAATLAAHAVVIG